MNKVLPEAFLKCMSPEDRKAIGQMTAEEAMTAFTAKTERKLQSQIVNLLRLKGIEVLWHRTDKKSAATVGWPDLTFAVTEVIQSDIPPFNEFWITHACCWEVKLPGGELSKEQIHMSDRLISEPNAWHYRVIRSVDEALKELKAMGIR